MRPLSVIIPALNEAKTLPGNVAALLQSDVVEEVIVVDGGSTDGTFEAMSAMANTDESNRLKVFQSEPGRGQQMNYGARFAQAPWLLFHHADSRLPDAGLKAIAALDEAACWGGFEHSFSPNNWKLKVVSWLHNYRCRRTGVVYGDQSMFVRRSFFAHLGGFRPDTIEDLEFSDRAVALAPSVLLPIRVQTDSRKFLQIGEFRALFQVCVILWRYERNRRVGVEGFFKPYR